ncbi:phosphinothricin acetyltransferase [Plasticicumulans lactativorans]|uniref:Phosphinothricin acetyltransferase n=1 Tax=Plasticicumulans lactativorans TaxID=1133106 RepID=A0A4R2LF40_9GAMM|nr:GNAT family N-acetyltransferase [Plasticicumulans lactativorans]TCO83367.1 phosphinothricin acetyltransferase [Plasticicumulans lactativorans]
MTLRDARAEDLPAIVDLYNAAIPGRLATADTEPVSVAARAAWFAEFDPARRPCLVAEGDAGTLHGWGSLRSFYGRPAYHATVECAVYVAPAAQGTGVGGALLDALLARAPACGIRTVLAFVFGHNAPSLGLFTRRGFARWGLLPAVAELDGVERDLVLLGRRL